MIPFPIQEGPHCVAPRKMGAERRAANINTSYGLGIAVIKQEVSETASISDVVRAAVDALDGGDDVELVAENDSASGLAVQAAAQIRVRAKRRVTLKRLGNDVRIVRR